MNLMTIDPAAHRTTGAADVLSFGTSACALGEVLVARSATGVCAVLIGDTAAGLETDLAARFSNATLVAEEAAVRAALARVVRFMVRPAGDPDPDFRLDFDLDLRGTPFQRRVWEHIRAIPAGRTVSYAELARRVGPTASPRAVAAACAANPVALAVPCHRVVRTDGGLAGYRWGLHRKRELLERETTA